MNRTERMECLSGLTGMGFGQARRNISAVNMQLTKHWGFDKNPDIMRRISNDWDSKALEMRLILEYYFIKPERLAKINWRKFKKMVTRDFGSEFSDCFNAPVRVKLPKAVTETASTIAG